MITQDELTELAANAHHRLDEHWDYIEKLQQEVQQLLDWKEDALYQIKQLEYQVDILWRTQYDSG